MSSEESASSPASGFLFLWLPFLISWGVLSRYLSTFSVRTLSVHTLVSAIFALCFDLFVLVVYELLDVLGPYRHFTWRCVLFSLVVLLAIVLPYLLLHLLVEGQGLRAWGSHLVASILAGVWLWTFWAAGSLFPVVSAGDHDFLSLEGAIGRLGVVGVIIVACLSGYGAVTNPYALLSRVQVGRVSEKSIQVQREALRAAKNRLASLQRSLSEAERRRREAVARGGSLHPLSHAASGSTSSPASSSYGSTSLSWPMYLLHSVFGSGGLTQASGLLLGSEASLGLNVAGLARDVELAETIELEEQESLSAMLEARQQQNFSKTLLGRATSALGIFLSLYCVYRILITVYNVLLRRDPTKDPITRVLEVRERKWCWGGEGQWVTRWRPHSPFFFNHSSLPLTHTKNHPTLRSSLCTWTLHRRLQRGWCSQCPLCL